MAGLADRNDIYPVVSIIAMPMVIVRGTDLVAMKAEEEVRTLKFAPFDGLMDGIMGRCNFGMIASILGICSYMRRRCSRPSFTPNLAFGGFLVGCHSFPSLLACISSMMGSLAFRSLTPFAHNDCPAFSAVDRQAISSGSATVKR